MTSDITATNSTHVGPAHHPVAKGYLVHCVTASGAICGMFGLIAVADKQPRAAVLWLAVAMILDGVDGPVARAWSVRECVPRIDGYALDLIIDYVTCIVIPVLFLHRFAMLPHGWSLYIGAFMLFSSALWMSRTDQMSSDHFFNGFPCEWNMIVPTLYLLNAEKWVVAAACVVLALTQFTNIKFPHPMQVRLFRPLTVGITIVWLAAVLFMIGERHANPLGIYPLDRPAPLIGVVLLIVCPVYIVGLGIWRTLKPDVVIRLGQPTQLTAV
jgi:phosphatidylcholine synthase